MNEGKRRFIPYNSLSAPTIEKIAKGLEEISEIKLKELVLDAFSEYLRDQALKELPPCSIETTPLLNVPDALVLVSFDRYPLIDSGSGRVGGLARILNQPQTGAVPPIPVIYLTPYRTKDTLRHEKVHICQYLLDEAFPMTPEQKNLFLAKNLKSGGDYLLKNAGRDAATDFIINAICYKTWIEMEANYVTRKPKDSWQWMMKVYRSALPITSFEAASWLLDWKTEDMNEVRTRFEGFCKTMEEEVKWVRDLVRGCMADSLPDLILETHHEFEIDMMFGPL